MSQYIPRYPNNILYPNIFWDTMEILIGDMWNATQQDVDSRKKPDWLSTSGKEADAMQAAVVASWLQGFGLTGESPIAGWFIYFHGKSHRTWMIFLGKIYRKKRMIFWDIPLSGNLHLPISWKVGFPPRNWIWMFGTEAKEKCRRSCVKGGTLELQVPNVRGCQRSCQSCCWLGIPKLVRW